LEKPRIVYLIDHVHDDLVLDQMCHVHNKDWLSKYFDILFITRTLSPSFVKQRANFTIKSFNRSAPYVRMRDEIERFNPSILQIFGPTFLGNTNLFLQDFHGKCKIVERYAGAFPGGYGGDLVDYVVVDDVHVPAFGNIPPEKLVVTRNCADLDFFKPMYEVEKDFDGIQVGGFYCHKGQDVLVDMFKNRLLRFLFIGSQKSNEGIETEEYIQTKRLYDNLATRLTVKFVDFVPPAQLPRIYNQAKLFLWGAQESYENPITLTNRAVVEAVACGLPIVGFRKTFKYSNFIIDRENAILADTAEDFVNAVINLLTDTELRNKLGNRSREIAVERLDFQVWHNEFFMNLYNRILLGQPANAK